VDDANVMRALKAERQLVDQVDHLAKGQTTLPHEPLSEVFAIKGFEHEVGDGPIDSVVEHPGDVARTEPGRGLRLALEALAELLGAGKPGRHELQRDVDFEGAMVRAPDRAHAAAAELLDEQISGRR
jgi:hypothetical protein